MRKQYTYEFELWHEEKYWCIAPFDLGGGTQGVSIEDACESAADFLRITMIDYLMRGKTPPKPTFNNETEFDGMRVIVSVDASLDDVPKVSASKAAEILGVSPSRITAMVSCGLLEGWKDGRNSWITQESVEARLESAPKAGRPRKELKTA